MTVHVTDPVQVVDRLREFGLDRDLLLDAVRASASARNSATEHHPAWFPGSWAHAEAVRTLRDGAVGRGWQVDRPHGLELLLDDAGLTAVLVCSGDPGTGQHSRPTSTKYPRGPAGQEALEQNQLSLFVTENKRAGKLLKTWILLIHQTEEAVFSELSLAETISELGHIATWAERIYLPPVDLGPEGGRNAKAPSIDPTDAVDVTVRRRG